MFCALLSSLLLTHSSKQTKHGTDVRAFFE
jgi:hypothetical protein